MPEGRILGFAAWIDPFLYYLGGQYGPDQSTVYRYDPLLNVWTTRTALSGTRNGAAGGVYNGKVYLISGQSTLGTTSTTEYDPATGVSTSKATAPAFVQNGASDVYNNKIYYHDSASMYLYDPLLNTYTTLTSDSMALSDGAGSFGPDNKFHVMGGGAGWSTLHRVYDPATNAWAAGTALPSAIGYMPGAIQKGGLIYLIGGTVSNVYQSTVRAFDTVTSTWSDKASIPAARSYIGEGVARSGSAIYVAGGYDGFYQPTLFAFASPEVDGGVASARGVGLAADFAFGAGGAMGAGVSTGLGQVRASGKRMYSGPLPLTGQGLIDYHTDRSPVR